MKLNPVSLAIATALFISAPAIAQEKDPADGKAPTGPAPESALGAIGLPGLSCSGESGINCSGAIPVTGVVNSTFTLPGCTDGSIDDLNVGLDISHTWVGDLRITLTSPDATSVVIMDRPGRLDSGVGCSGNDILAVLDDSGTVLVEDTCFSNPAIAGTLIPNNPLAAFNGQSGSGDWSLLVEDVEGGDSGTLNDWSLDATCSAPAEPRATFRVTKDFSDDNPGEVNVKLDCNTGLVLDQDKLISEGEYVEFVVTDFDDGELNCTITEDVPAGYSPEYFSNSSSNAVGCEFEAVAFGSAQTCNIVNTPDPVTLTVNKTWLYPSSTVDTDERFDLYFTCDAEIEGGYSHGPGDWHFDADGREGNGATSITVHPTWEGKSCSVSERSYDSSVEADVSGCQGVAIELGSDASCEITNTVFYEGIPTLSHYGLAILALSMFGLGMVGFRRYS